MKNDKNVGCGGGKRDVGYGGGKCSEEDWGDI